MSDLSTSTQQRVKYSGWQTLLQEILAGMIKSADESRPTALSQDGR